MAQSGTARILLYEREAYALSVNSQRIRLARSRKGIPVQNISSQKNAESPGVGGFLPLISILNPKDLYTIATILAIG